MGYEAPQQDKMAVDEQIAEFKANVTPSRDAQVRRTPANDWLFSLNPTLIFFDIDSHSL